MKIIQLEEIEIRRLEEIL